jgi:hypothetical protein
MGNYVLIIILLFSGFGPWQRAEAQEGGKIEREREYVFWLPQRWDEAPEEYREEPWNGDHRKMITKDGVPLESIEIRYRELDNEDFTFANTKKRIAAGMAPLELSEIVLDDMSASREFTNFKVLENKPAEIGGMRAFKAVFSFADNRHLRYKSVYYGFVTKKYFYSIQFLAPSRYYFDKYLSTFDKVVQAFKLK